MALGQRVYKEGVTRTLPGDVTARAGKGKGTSDESTTGHVGETTQVVPVPLFTDALKGEANNEHDPCFY